MVAGKKLSSALTPTLDKSSNFEKNVNRPQQKKRLEPVVYMALTASSRYLGQFKAFFARFVLFYLILMQLSKDLS